MPRLVVAVTMETLNMSTRTFNIALPSPRLMLATSVFDFLRLDTDGITSG